MRARVVGVLVLAVLLVAGLGSAAFAAASCTTYDAQNLPTSTFRGGEKIIVRGTGFGPNARVLISLQQGTRTIELSGANANDLGAFAATDAAIPASVAAGDATIRAIDARGSATCAVTLEAAAEDDDGVSGVFWIWGALLAVFAVVLGVLTYRRWKTERLKEAVDSLAWRDQYDSRVDDRRATVQRVPMGPSHPLPLETHRDQRPTPYGFDRTVPPRDIRPRDAPRAPQVFDPGREPMRGGFDESMRSTAPFRSSDDDDSPIGAPLPFDDRFTVDDNGREVARGRMSPDRDEVAWRPELPPPTRDFDRERHDAGEAQAFDPSPRRDVGGRGYRAHPDQREPVRSFHAPDVRDAIERDEWSSPGAFLEDDDDRTQDDRRFADRRDHPVGHETTAPDRTMPERPAVERVIERSVVERAVVEHAAPDRSMGDMDRPASPPVGGDVPAPPIARRSVADQPATSFADALREFLDTEDQRARAVSEPAPHRRPPTATPPAARVEPAPVDRPPPAVPPTSRTMPVAPIAEPNERRDDEMPPELPTYRRSEPRRRDAPPAPEPTRPSEPTAPMQPIERIQPSEAIPPSESFDQIEPAPPSVDRSPEPRPVHPAVPLRFAPRAPRPPATGRGAEPAAYRPPPEAVPPPRPRAGEHDQDPPVLPVGWDDGRLRPSHKRSSDAIERLRREVRDWRR